MSLRPDELEFELRQGWKTWIKWVLLPLVAWLMIMGVIAAGYYGIQSARMPQGPPNIMNPDDTNASTDLYADSLFAALSCMKLEEEGGCNIEDRKSNMIQNVTSEILVVNNQKYPIPEKGDLLKAVKDTELSKITYSTLLTEQRGENVEDITYENDQHTVTVFFSKNIEGELLVTNIAIETKE